MVIGELLGVAEQGKEFAVGNAGLGLLVRLAMPGRSSNSSNPNDDYKFTGYELDNEARLTMYHAGARGYDPVLGRFNQVDPLFDHPQQIGLSPYNYSWNNPVNLSDPTGECPSCVKFFVKSANKVWKQVSRKKALQVRKTGKNVKLEGESAKRTGKKFENDAFPEGNTRTKFDDGHVLDDGTTGLPHFQQTKRSIKGHTSIDNGKAILAFIFTTLLESMPVHAGDLGDGTLPDTDGDGIPDLYQENMTLDPNNSEEEPKEEDKKDDLKKEEEDEKN